jgi:hypothetical protein
VNATGRSLCSLSSKQEEMYCNGDDILRGLWCSGTLCNIHQVIILPLRLIIISKAVWSDFVFCEGVGISQNSCLCCPHQYIVQHSRSSITELHHGKCLQSCKTTPCFNWVMCFAAQMWFVKCVGWSLKNSKQNSVQTLFQIFQLPSLMFYWNMKGVRMIMSMEYFHKT